MAKSLVVDDSRMARDLVCFPLQEAGHEAMGVEPSSLLDVLKTISTFNPDLVITDYQMPNCNGESLVRAIREDPSFKQTPIMLITAHRDEELVRRLSGHGLSGILFKGKGMEELVSQVSKILGT
jgi:two-component system, chemotaxis family, chemotaxis protein CheY